MVIKIIKNKGAHSSAGFTLLEIIIAVMVLAVSLTTLLGLQSSATDEAIRTRNKHRAMLAAREVMAALENEGGDLKPSKINGSIDDILDRYMPEGLKKEGSKEESLPLMGELEIAFWNIKSLPENSLLKATLKVYWSNNPQDEINVVYFIAAH